MCIHKAVLYALHAASALALASPAGASDLPVAPYDDLPTYERHTYEYQTAPAVVAQPAPVVSDTVIIRRPVILAPRVVVEEYPVYPAPRAHVAPPAYAYGGPGWRRGWNYRHHSDGGW